MTTKAPPERFTIVDQLPSHRCCIESFTTPSGNALVWYLLCQKSKELHGFQIQYICQLLDGTDVFAITAMGDSKSQLFCILILGC
ncbi:hypothetical protein HETIRDRAFT_316995 [Heterobasidion irregulare TC 32-1]|uniref:Uncharacterized protein n=1 Tax=Heterobasidion irregulare (strain TC 32-1) TaxID=747525 RepID=W4K8V8_HETIT|nr:uncharacterized protein HETIRDRAFT_316995 [Heterobasidion irregulare TC 32-1]ETW82189.1 hypothetical protein HETIRDRAFT_316995 [Heterobasidion irregulare TC 32-1]